MIRFFYNAGSAATKELLTDSIREDLQSGHEVILLVPEQETVSVERRMLEILPPSAQLSFEVLNFSRLANRAFRKLGGLSYHAATPAVSALLMWRSLSELAPQLRQYGAAAKKDSKLSELMLQTAAQCKAACIDAEQLLDAAGKLADGEPLKDKLHDIGWVLSTYSIRLGERFDDTSNELLRLAKLLIKDHKKPRDEDDAEKELLANTHVYIDSFTDFTVQELEVLKALFAVAPSVSVTFPLESHNVTDGLHLTSVLHTHKRLSKMAKDIFEDVEYRNEVTHKPTNALEYLKRHLFDMKAEPAPLGMEAEKAISLCTCATPFEEASAIATEIHRLVREGCRYRDITVVVRDATVWNGILDDAFEREGIPFFLSEKTDITLKPLIKLIIEAFRIRTGNWRMEDVVGYLKTGLCGISADDINLFEEYVNVWRPRGEKAYTGGPFTKNPDGYKSEISERGTRILETANRVRETMLPPLVGFFKALDSAQSATEQCRALYEFLDFLDIREQLKASAEKRMKAGDRREAEELSRLYNVTVDALEAISDAIGDQPLSVSEFLDALRLVFSHTDIGTIPTSVDQVTIGSASMLRTDHPRFVLIAGLNGGNFPAIVKDDGLLGETDRQKLKEFDVVFPTGNEKMSSDELFYLQRAFSAPTDRLFLFYATNGSDGKALSPSIAISRVKALFPDLKPTVFGGGNPLDVIYSPAGAMVHIGRLSPSQSELMLRLLEERKLNAAKSLRLPVVDLEAAVSPTLADSLFDGSKFSPTQLEDFSLCRFKYYCRNILRLREECSDTISSADTGTFIHHVLEQVLLTVQKEKRPFGTYDERCQAQMVQDICARYRKEVLGAHSELLPRADALLDRMTTLSKLIVSGIFSELNDSMFTPAFLELSLSELSDKSARTTASDTSTHYSLEFFESEEDASVPTKKRFSLPLSGRIDRVDYWQDESGRVYLRVTDYKTGSRSFHLDDIKKGFCLQMPLYLLALCRGRHNLLCRRLNLPENTPFLPAGITYLSSNISTENSVCRRSSEAAMHDAGQRLVREGLVLSDAHVTKAMTKSDNKAIIGGGRDKTKKQMSEEDFDALFDTIEDTIIRISADMKSGSAEIKANCHGKDSPCDFCAYFAICRAAQKNND